MNYAVHRRDVSVSWAALNPYLYPGEIGFEVDTDKFKMGPGNWNDLTYEGEASSATGLASFENGVVDVAISDVETVVTDVMTETLPELQAGRGISLNTSVPGVVRPEMFTHSLGANSFAAVTSTTVETSHLAAPFAVSASDWSVDDYFEFYASGYLLNTSGGDRTFTFRLKIGSQAIYTVTTPNIPTGSGNRSWTFDGRFSFIEFAGTRPMGCVTFTLGGLNNTGYDLGSITRTPDANTFTLTSAFNLDFTVQMSGTAHASLGSLCQIAVLQRKDK